MIREGSWSALSSRYPHLQDAPVIKRNGEIVRFLSPMHTAVGAQFTARASALVFPKFFPESEATLQRVALIQTLFLLQESGFSVPHSYEAIRAFLMWLQSLPAYTLTYSNLTEAVEHTRTLLSA